MGPLTVVAVETLFDKETGNSGVEGILIVQGRGWEYLWDRMMECSEAEIQLNKLSKLDEVS